MPTYTYACSACAHRFEQAQSIHDDALTVCPECSGALRRVIGAVGVTFKGSGFYRTDSRGGAKGTTGGSSGASAGASAAKSTGSSSGGSSSSGSGSSGSGSKSSS